MPIKARWEYHGVYYTTKGSISAEEIYEARKFMFTPPEGIEPQYQIVDARESDKIDLDQMELFNVSADDLAVGRKYPDLKIAFISINKQVEETFINHFKISWSLNTVANIRLFNSVQAARNWINLPYPKSNENDANGSSAQNRITLPKDPD
ncbi:MAG: hypothetical protein OEQ81_11715 [Flavobacteriaceae bacterium]|nr:hypothetical protein [Flavobacteriaceae bacterium]